MWLTHPPPHQYSLQSDILPCKIETLVIFILYRNRDRAFFGGIYNKVYCNDIKINEIQFLYFYIFVVLITNFYVLHKGEKFAW